MNDSTTLQCPWIQHQHLVKSSFIVTTGNSRVFYKNAQLNKIYSDLPQMVQFSFLNTGGFFNRFLLKILWQIAVFNLIVGLQICKNKHNNSWEKTINKKIK